MNRLTVGYSALADRVAGIKPPNAPFDLLLVVQNAKANNWQDKLPKALKDSAVIDELNSVGVAKSRNRVIELASTDYLVFADDDIEFVDPGLNAVINYLDANPEVALVLAQATDYSGKLRKPYPGSEQALTKLNSARAATYEMVIRVSAIKELGIRFDENFGAGVENYLGDEYIFVADLLSAGGKAVFLPITIATHPEVSSGSGWGTDRDRRARAKVFTRVFGALAPVVRLAFGLRRLGLLGGAGNLVRFVFGR